MKFTNLTHDATRCERVDDRYYKTYGNKIYVVARVEQEMKHWEGHYHPADFTDLEDRVKASAIGQHEHFVKVHVLGDRHSKTRRFTLEFFIPAKRPKEIRYPDSDGKDWPEGLNVLGIDPNDFLAEIRAYLKDWVAACKQRQDWETAHRLAEEVVSAAREKAREITRHEQRLAALCAETDAEAEVQLQKLLADPEWGLDAQYDNGKPVGRHIMAAIHKYATEYQTPHAHRGRMGSTRNKIDIEDLKPEKQEESV